MGALCHPRERSAQAIGGSSHARFVRDMPLLPQEKDVFPDDFLSSPPESESTDDPSTWVAFYTLSRREKDLMRKLRAAEIPHYAPLVRRRLRSAGGRVRWSFVPLFPGYVFSLATDDQRRIALATNTVSRWLSVTDGRTLLDDLRAIHQLIASERPLTPEARLERGQPVRVKAGPLRGLEGTVVKRHGTERLVIAVRFLNQGASIELEDVDLERL